MNLAPPPLQTPPAPTVPSRGPSNPSLMPPSPALGSVHDLAASLPRFGPRIRQPSMPSNPISSSSRNRCRLEPSLYFRLINLPSPISSGSNLNQTNPQLVPPIHVIRPVPPCEPLPVPQTPPATLARSRVLIITAALPNAHRPTKAPSPAAHPNSTMHGSSQEPLHPLCLPWFVPRALPNPSSNLASAILPIFDEPRRPPLQI